MRLIAGLAATLILNTAAEARCLASPSKPLVFTKSHCEELYEAHRVGVELPLTYVCNVPILGNRPDMINAVREQERSEMAPEDFEAE